MNTHNNADAEYGTRLAVSPSKAAYKLDISLRHLNTLLKTGELKSFKSGRCRRVRLTELDRYIAERETSECL